jgi:hypothetical protein
MDGSYISSSPTFLTQTFALNSFTRQTARKGQGRKPNPLFSRRAFGKVPAVLQSNSGKKCSVADLSILSQHFDRYIQAVNLILQKVYNKSDAQAKSIGWKLDTARGRGYVILREEPKLNWEQNNEFGQLVFERMFRNALETAARIILADYSRRELVRALLRILMESGDDISRLVGNKRIPPELVRRVCDSVTCGNGSGFHYALSACKQVRRALDEAILSAFDQTNSTTPLHLGGGRRNKQRARVREILECDAPQSAQIRHALCTQVEMWHTYGFPFTSPVFRMQTEDFSASTENTTGQGYWFKVDPDRQDEIILYLKTPPGVLGHETDKESPYRSQTLRFRFLNWLPHKAQRARRKAREALRRGDSERALRLEFRASHFEDMSSQLMNMVALHHAKRTLAKLTSRRTKDRGEIERLRSEVTRLKDARRCAPPTIQLGEGKASLSIPFRPPSQELLKSVLPSQSRTRYAGVDRGLRNPVVISISNGDGDYEERIIRRRILFIKREKLRQRARQLASQIARRRNNWESKHPGQIAPDSILKRERELGSVWLKVRRLNREISHQVACETVWFCESRKVKTVYFEDLRFFQGAGGMHTHSWNLSTNLWSLMIKGVRYRREALGHYKGGVWMVNPAWTSQICSGCGERGVRVEYPLDTEETKGGEYFFCSHCQMNLHADVNAARNIVKIQMESSAIPGRTA